MKWNGIDPRLHRPKFPGVSPHSSVFPGAVAQGAELGGGNNGGWYISSYRYFG